MFPTKEKIQPQSFEALISNKIKKNNNGIFTYDYFEKKANIASVQENFTYAK